jgi:F-type H+-transporting ATPase subunit delta
LSSSANPSSPKIIAGDAAVLSRRYAGALYELAEEQKQLDTVADNLRLLATLVHESAEFQSIAAHPRLNRTQLVKAAQTIAKGASLHALTANFLSLIAQNRRLNILGSVIESFLAELAARRGEYTAEIRAAKPLTTAQHDQLAAQLRAMVGGKVHMAVREDASLLGGLVVKVGSRLIDASIKTKLSRLERQLKSQTMQSHTVQKGAA